MSIVRSAQPSRRRERRESVIIFAQCRTDTGRSGQVVITDLTREGCRIFAKALPLGEGLRVRIKPDDFQTLPGVVRWVHRGNAGIEFESPLYGPVAEHLQRIFAR